MDLKQIPYLLQLLEDDSEVVRLEVTKALKAYGPELTAEVERLQVDLSPESRKVLTGILAVHRREWLRRVWPDWYKAGDELASLEAAGFGKPRTYCEPDSGVSGDVVWPEQKGPIESFKAMCFDLLNVSSSEWFLLCEDDLVVSSQ